MKDKRKIKEIYNCIHIDSDGELYPLQKWYNQLIEKTIDEINVMDVLRMIRQKEFMELAISKVIFFLQEDVFAGEAYEGEMLEKLSEIEGSLLKSHEEDIKNIIKNALEKSQIHNWSYDSEEEEFREIIDILSKKLYNI